MSKSKMHGASLAREPLEAAQHPLPSSPRPRSAIRGASLSPAAISLIEILAKEILSHASSKHGEAA
jgi:hypothetical protein